MTPNVFSRRSFIAQTSCFGAFYALANTITLPALAESVGIDSRIQSTPLVDKGLASVREVGNGLYATISDPSKGATTLSNGGFLVGKDAALLIEGYSTAAGASFQMEGTASCVARKESQVILRSSMIIAAHADKMFSQACPFRKPPVDR
jgi:hypothetical protein